MAATVLLHIQLEPIGPRPGFGAARSYSETRSGGIHLHQTTQAPLLGAPIGPLMRASAMPISVAQRYWLNLSELD